MAKMQKNLENEINHAEKLQKRAIARFRRIKNIDRLTK